MTPYDHKKIEKKWQKKWLADKAFSAKDSSRAKKFYALVEFPFPSGDGLHTGHIRSYTGMDIIARKRRAEGYNVLYPIGWDAFGLPTENYAIKVGKDPRIVTKQNTNTFRKQLQSLGISFDWQREINTTDPAYYQWTQWIFLQLYKKGLAYKAEAAINWCPKDKIGLANEEVVNGACERCGTLVEKRTKAQWMLAITKYAERLYNDLDSVDYLEKIKTQQRNWIGKSEGAEIGFKVIFEGGQQPGLIPVFTTRPDTIFGATYMVLSPEHLWVTLALDENHTGVLKNADEVRAYVEKAKQKTEIERTKEEKEKTGVELKGVKAINPATGEKIPIFVADYVLAHYGTGAVMAVPAHDERDFAFAKKYNLHILRVINHDVELPLPDTQNGFLINSEKFNGIDSEQSKDTITQFVGGKKVVKFKLRDWVFSRQRYWGEPIPIIHCAKCGTVPVLEKDLPVTLPKVKNYQPTDTGESPLANIASWVNTKCPQCKGSAKRETDVMPNWAGSSWYFLRYIDPKNKKALADKKKLKHWMQVDWYNGGMEHTTLHLLYSRFWNKFLFDIGVVPTSEPYKKRTSHGLILAGDGEKMSKSRGNVVNPDGIVSAYGADTLRLYEMFMGPFSDAISWNTDNLVGLRRFIERIWRLSEKVKKTKTKDDAINKALAKTIVKVSDDIEALSFNTAVSALMIFSNELDKKDEIEKSVYETFLILLSPFAPHVAEELWQKLGNKNSLLKEKWPTPNKKDLVEETRTIGVQINGKVRASVELSLTAGEEEVKDIIFENPRIKELLLGKEILRFVYVPGKIVNIVIASH
jgi:leucyl-tRNA synthetase